MIVMTRRDIDDWSSTNLIFNQYHSICFGFVHISCRHQGHCIRALTKRGTKGIGKSIPDPRDFLTPDRFPEAEVREKSRGSREVSRAEGVDFPIPLEFLVEKGHSIINNLSSGSGSRNPFVDCPRDTLCFPIYYVIIVIAVTPSHKKIIDQLHRW